jgi:hypothetical protein
MGNARAKLNVSYFNGCLFVAAVFGLIAESWLVFVAAMALSIACGIYSDDIRPVAGRR